MPSKNQLKDYQPKSFYHIYNRGVGKMQIFHDEQDYTTLIYYLKLIFSPPETLEKELAGLKLLRNKKNNNNPNHSLQIESKIRNLTRALNKAYRHKTYQNAYLLGYCLMPNHFHLLVYQRVEDVIITIMRRLGTAYSKFYVDKYNWVGPIVQGRYSAAHLSYEPELQALVTGRYVERNILHDKERPSQRLKLKSITNYPYSSLKYYVREERGNGKSPAWLNTKFLTNIFQQIKEKPSSDIENIIASHNSYVDFILSGVDLSAEDVRLSHLASLG